MVSIQNSRGQLESPCNCGDPVWIGEPETITNLTGLEFDIEGNSCYAIFGTLVIDQSDTWVDCNFLMDEGSKIIVTASLEMDRCHLSSCQDEMWIGLDVRNNAFLDVDDVTIEAAEIGIELKSNSSIHCRNSEFKNDYIGISAGRPFDEDQFSQIINQLRPITGCLFCTDGHLPDPYPGQYYDPSWPTTPAEIYYDQGYAAIYLSGASGLTLGFAGATGANRNEIRNMRNGVIMRHSTCNIAGTDFHDFEGEMEIALSDEIPDLNHHAINMFKSSGIIRDNFIEEVISGVFTYQSVATIINNGFDVLSAIPALSSTYGIKAESPQTHTILDNYIHNGFKGIQMKDASLPFLIKNNELFRDFEAGKHAGIEIMSAKYGPDTYFGHIRENDVLIEDAHLASGINILTGSKLNVIFNDIFFDEVTDAGNGNVGIVVSEGGQSAYISNIVDADPVYKTESINTGILALSQDNRIECNLLDNMSTLMKVVGRNTMTALKQNKFYDANIGLNLVGQVWLGTQRHHLNQWFGDFNSYGAYINGVDPVMTALSSTFIAEDDDQDPCVFIPCDYGPPSVENIWFRDIVNNDPPATECPYVIELAPTDEDSLATVILSPFEFEEYNDEMEWLVKADIFDMILNFPALLNNEVLDSFFTAEEETNLGILIQMQYNLYSRFGVGEDKDEKLDSIDRFILDISYLDSLLFTEPGNHATLKGLRDLKVDSLTSVMNDLLDMLEGEDAASISEYEDIYEELYNLSPANDLESHLKEALRLKARYLLNSPFSSGDSASMLELTELCPWEGGRAIAIAQELYTRLMDSTINSIIYECPESDPFIGHDPSHTMQESEMIVLYPNPTDDVVEITSPRKIKNIYILSPELKCLQTETPNQRQWKLNLSRFTPGFYLMMVVTDQRKSLHKIALLR